MAFLVGVTIAFSACGPHWLLRGAMFAATLFLASVAFSLAVGPVGWGAYTTMVAYLALGSGRCFVQLGRRGRASG